MKFRPTPETLEGIYSALRACPPFKRWKLPLAENVEFHVTRHHDREGDYYRDAKGEHVIRASERFVLHDYQSLSALVAHEMIHLAQFLHGHENRAQHNADFKRRAKRVCQILGFDPATFVG